MPDRITLAGRYVLEAEIARGGMGTVWRATDERLARSVAVKVLHPHLVDDEAFVTRFRLEALGAAKLVHPNIVAIYDTGTEEIADGDTYFIVMEFCPGGSLADICASDSGVEPATAARMGAEICDALHHAHARGVIHRDVKPANVLVASDGMLKVGDFGIAKPAFATGDVTATGTILGTVAYISPEQARGEEPDARSDIYSTGALLYELLVGRPPFREETPLATAMRHVHDAPPRPTSLKSGIPRAIEGVVVKALEKDPRRRWQTAHEMGAALAACTHDPARRSRPKTKSQAPRPARAQRHGEREPRWIAMVVGLIVAAVAAAFILSASLGEDDDGTTEPPTRPDGVQAAQPTSAADFDPHGGDGEHPDEVAAAWDGDDATAWTTETYEDSFELQEKPGVGLLFDLGREVDVSEVRVVSVTPGYDLEIRASDTRGSIETDYEEVAEVVEGAERESVAVESDAFRYWLVWITSLPGEDGGTFSLNEVSFFGS